MRLLAPVCRAAGFLAALALTQTAVGATQDVHVLRYIDGGDGTRVGIEQYTEPAEWRGDAKLIKESVYPRFIEEHAPVSLEQIVEVRTLSESALQAIQKERGITAPPAQVKDARDEVVTLVDSGPAANRIDLVFMGDGYTEAEREKFFLDMQRLVDDMFRGQTFASYLPLFNVHAVFRASNESGIGRNDTPKDTAYGLYRAGNTLRAIYPSNSSAARVSCRAAPGCDYPVIIANDPYYGGLGGEFAISTSSETSGTIVLRHELGHNFGRVGEEYDGGGYFGANNSSSLSSLKWEHWIDSAENLLAQPAKALFLDWPWENLGDGPFVANFNSDGEYPYAKLRFSVSGIPEADQVEIKVNDTPLPFTSRGTEDRTFYDYELDAFTAGAHSITFTEQVSDGNNWVSSMTVHEFKEDYNFDRENIGAYPVFSRSGRVAGYRSNHEKCLMRNMKSPDFCSVCVENNWLQFFGKIDMIDGVSQDSSEAGTTVTLATQELGQLRASGLGRDGERLLVRWFRNGSEVEGLADQFQWTLPTRDAQGTWEVRVEFVTPEVRKDDRELLKDSATFRI